MARTKTGLRTVRLPELLVERLTGHPWILSAADKERRAEKRTGTPSVSDLVALCARIGLDSADVMERARTGADLRATHLALVDAVNDAKTREDHDAAEARLRKWRDGVGPRVSLTDADWHTGARYGFPDLGDGCPPICAGVRLDWSPDGYPAVGGGA